MSKFDDLGYDALQEASQEAWKNSRGTDMSVKPDYEAAKRAFEESYYGAPNNIELVIRRTVDAALGDDLLAFAVAALIAEGGEIEWRCQHTRGGERLCREVNAYDPTLHTTCGKVLVYGPLGTEEETR